MNSSEIQIANSVRKAISMLFYINSSFFTSKNNCRAPAQRPTYCRKVEKHILEVVLYPVKNCFTFKLFKTGYTDFYCNNMHLINYLLASLLPGQCKKSDDTKN